MYFNHTEKIKKESSTALVGFVHAKEDLEDHEQDFFLSAVASLMSRYKVTKVDLAWNPWEKE